MVNTILQGDEKITSIVVNTNRGSFTVNIKNGVISNVYGNNCSFGDSAVLMDLLIQLNTILQQYIGNGDI